MKILILNSSPKAEKGNTHIMVQSFAAGATAAGAKVENIFLSKYKIMPCTACLACWFKTPGQCVLNDDVKIILDKMATVDLVIFATPLYVDNVSGIMKNFMDRMIAAGHPEMELDENNEARHVTKANAFTKIGVISNCGFPEQTQFDALRLLFKRIARNMACELVVELYRGEGSLLSFDIPDLKSAIDAYKALLEKAGQETVMHGKVQETTQSRLEKPLIPYDVYIKAVNTLIEKKIKQIN